MWMFFLKSNKKILMGGGAELFHAHIHQRFKHAHETKDWQPGLVSRGRDLF